MIRFAIVENSLPGLVWAIW